MKKSKLRWSAICMLLTLSIQVNGQESRLTPQELLTTLVGSWEGTCRTWFRPDQLGDESTIKGEFQFFPVGQFLRNTYEGQIQGRPRVGEETA